MRVVTGSYHTVIMYHTFFHYFISMHVQAYTSSNSCVIKEDILKGIYIAYISYRYIVEGCGFSLHGGFPHGRTKIFWGFVMAYHYEGET